MSTATINHCSLNAQHVSHESPIGTASGFARSFLIQLPLPWAKIPLETQHLPQEVKDAIAAFQEQRGAVTITLIAPDREYPADGARLIDLQMIDGALTRREILMDTHDLADTIRAMAHDEPLPPSATIDDTLVRDIAVCTHGSRDACCATFGIPMYVKLREAAKSLPNTRVWRCSHLGGHRFAPTLIDYPAGRSWGFVDEDTARTILLNDREPAAIIDHYRGWVGHKGAELQMLEAQILAEIGWEWGSYRQRGEILERDEQGRGALVQITGEHDSRPGITWRGEIVWGDEFETIASCNAAPVTYVRKTVGRSWQVTAAD